MTHTNSQTCDGTPPNPLLGWFDWVSEVSCFWGVTPAGRGDECVSKDDSEFTLGQFEGMAYMLYRPAARPAKSLLLMLHGCGQQPVDFAKGTAMNEAALKAGFAVLYPAQSSTANSQGCWNWHLPSHQERGQGEPAMLAALTLHVAMQCQIDPKRVYAAGLSAGGAMAAILGETYPEVFTAIGVHSGIPTRCATDLNSALAAMNGRGHTPSAISSQVPMIVFHGDGDTTVHSCNGERLAIGCAGEGAISKRTTVLEGGRHSTRTVHRTRDGKVIAEHWCIHGAAHRWSGGNAAGTYADHLGPNASAKMLKFFKQHSSK